MKTLSRRHFLTLGSVAGVASLSGCQDVVGEVADNRSGNRSENDANDLGLAISSSGPGCLRRENDVQSGWVHTVADGDTYDMTFDVRISHRRGEEVEVDLTTASRSGEYVLEFTVENRSEEPDERKQPIGDSDCDTGTRLKGGGNIPDDFEMLRVAFDDRTLKTIEREGTFGNLHPLPDPIKTGD